MNSDKNIIALTGAGISSESGIPTFKGKYGFWTIGSTNYQAEKMGTLVILISKKISFQNL